MASIQTKNTNILGISCLVLVLLALPTGSLSGCPTGKKSWPELVGVPGCEAAAQIKKENSIFKPIVIGEGTATPRNLDCRRVFVEIEGHEGLVSSTPYAG